MTTQTYAIPGAQGHSELRVKWNETTTDTVLTMAAHIYRWDAANTNNSGGKWEMRLAPDPAGAGFWGNQSWGSGSGEREVQYFNTRTYPRKETAYNIVLTISWTNYGTYYGNWIDCPDGYHQFILTVPAIADPDPVEDVTVSRVSDNAVNLTWTASPSAVTGVLVERKTDGGAFSQIATLAAGATSYTDSTTTADHSYTYRVRVTNGYKYSEYADGDAPATMTPAAPVSIVLARDAGGDIVATLENNSIVASALEYQSSSDLQTWSASTTVAGVVTSFVATGLEAGTYYIRARNTNTAGASAWVISNAVVTIAPPNPPTLTQPSAGVIDLSAGAVVFGWLHNPVDGSAQTSAQVQVAVNGGAFSTIATITGAANTYTYTPAWNVGDVITWRVRTKGADASYSDYSATKQFTVYTAPSLSFVVNKPPTTVSAMPIPCEVSYTDMTGFSCVSATVALYQGAALMFSEPMDVSGNTLTASLTVSEFMPENGETYIVKVTARSSSSLQTTAQVSFDVSYTPPKRATVEVSADENTGYITLLVAETDDVGAPIVSVDVVRVSDHRQILMTGASAGESYVDKYAPLNKAFVYQVISYDAVGLFAVNDVQVVFESGNAFAYCGDIIARGTWEPSGDVGISRPGVDLVYFPGRAYPTRFDSGFISEVQSQEYLIIEQENAEQYRAIMEAGGYGVYKNGRGQVFHADFSVSAKTDDTTTADYGTLAIDVTRIEGAAL